MIATRQFIVNFKDLKATEKLHCPKCKSVSFHQIGGILISLPAQYVYYCDDCKYRARLTFPEKPNIPDQMVFNIPCAEL